MEARGERLGAEQLLSHLDWIRKLARRLVADEDAAEDLAQDTWLSAWQRPTRERSNLRGWLAAVARNLARQRGRAETARAARERRVARPEPTPSAAELVLEASLQRALVGHVLALDEPYRSTILLHYFRGLSAAEIAAREEVAVATVRSRIVRALALLRAELDRASGGRATWMRAFVGLAAAETAAASGLSAAAIAAIAMIGVGAAAITWALAGRSAVPSASTVVLAPEVPLPTSPATSQAAVGASEVADRVALSEVGRDAALASTATIDLCIRDRASGAPIGDLGFVVYSERQNRKRLASGATDVHGCARIEGLPADVLIVRTERRPPYTNAQRALALAAGETRTLELLPGNGGTLQGRVVDERGAAREGIEIRMAGGPEADLALLPSTARRPPSDTDVVATTGADGRFAVAHVHSRADGVWVVDGTDRPERWEPVRLWAVDPRWTGYSGILIRAQIEEGARAESGDHVLERDGRISGEVRWADGSAAGGVLVSAHPRRSGSLDFGGGSGWKPASSSGSDPATFPGEVLSAPDGRFDLAVPTAGAPRSLFVCTREGWSMRAQVPWPGAGTNAEVAPIVLAHRAPLEFELELELEGPMPNAQRFSLRHRQRDGTELNEHSRVIDVDGLLRSHRFPDPAELTSIEVSSDGWEPARIDLPGGTSEGARLRAILRRRPELRLSVRWRPSTTGKGIPDHPLVFRACLASRAQRRAAVDDPVCCGLGGQAFGPRGRPEHAVEMTVRARRPYWVHVRGTRGSSEQLWEQSFGPFVPSASLHAIELDPDAIDVSFEYQPGELEPAKLAPPPTTPSQPRVTRGQVRIRALDALTGAALVPRIRAFDGRRAGTISNVHSPIEGDLVPIPLGTWRLHVFAPGYAEQVLATVEIVPGEERDFGTVRLQPLPVFRAQILDEHGAPPRKGLWASAAGTSADIGEDGQLQLVGDLPPSFTLRVVERFLASGPPYSQALHVARWASDEVVELRLQPWRTVAVEIDGLPADLRAAGIVLSAVPLDGLEAAEPSESSRLHYAPDPSGDPEAARRFELGLVPGRYRLELASLVCSANPVEFTVTAEGDPPALRLDVR